ncbi:MAG: zinc metallopeptidase [Verrucomicrobia bacterium]|nr:zinc metallopeptidase [Verrucomicrobiota bacterium]
MFYGPTDFMFFIPALIITIWSQWKLRSTYGKYSQIEAKSGLTGADVARQILDGEGLDSVPVEEVEGHLTDHYDPRTRKVALSSDIYHGTSLAALGVAAHETGHAIQHKHAYAPLHIRMAIVPLTNFASGMAPLLLLGGFIIPTAFKFCLDLAILAFTLCVLFQVITLPVEYDASRRAKARLAGMGVVTEREAFGVSKVLNAAALTYVAGLLVAVLDLLRFVALRNSSDD